MQHPELPVVSFLSFFATLCVLPLQIRVGNVATIALVAWLSVMTLIRGINSLVWAGNVAIQIPVWCDITTKITIGFAFAIPAAVLCILTHLESIASTRNTISNKRTRQIFEFIMCFGLPVLFMALHYIIQDHRFDLFENLGCYPAIYYSLPALFLYYVPLLLMSFISFFFAILSIYRYLRLGTVFALHLRNNNSSITPNHYFRLMVMAVIVNLWVTAINIYIFIIANTLDGGLLPWTNAHSNWSSIAVYPTNIIPASLMAAATLAWWMIPILCFIVCMFLGFNTETLADYRSVVLWAWSKVLRREKESSLVLPFTNSPYDSAFSAHVHKPWYSYVSAITQTQGSQPISHSTSRPTSSINTTPSSTSTSDIIHEITLESHPYTVLPELRPSTTDSSSSRGATRDSDNNNNNNNDYYSRRKRELLEEITTSSEFQRLRLFTFPSRKETTRSSAA